MWFWQATCGLQLCGNHGAVYIAASPLSAVRCRLQFEARPLTSSATVSTCNASFKRKQNNPQGGRLILSAVPIHRLLCSCRSRVYHRLRILSVHRRELCLLHKSTVRVGQVASRCRAKDGRGDCLHRKQLQYPGVFCMDCCCQLRHMIVTLGGRENRLTAVCSMVCRWILGSDLPQHNPIFQQSRACLQQ